MLHIHFSNRYEVLTAHLLERLDAARGGDVFRPDQLIVPSTAVRRSLTLAIAAAHGVCANVAFSYLAPWLWRQLGRLLPSAPPESPFVQSVLAWRVHAVLGDAGFVSDHPRLASYLDGADDVMRFELAGRIAAVLDQYLTYRADWLEAWQAGRGAELGSASAEALADQRWQAALWRRLVDATDAAAANPGAAFAAAVARTDAAGAAAAGLPPCAHVFVLSTMPALHIAWLQQIGRLTDVHVYVLNPCQEYWFELIDRRRLSHLAARGRAGQHEEGNRLLAAWGQQTQAHVDGLVASAGDAATDDGYFVPNRAGTLLAALQNAILDLVELAPGSVPMAHDDRSVEVHVCHSLTRELEALQDHLLGRLAAGALRHPAEVLVVTPDLDAAAPLIEAVFGTAPRDRHIPFTITGRSRSRVNAPARALLELLALATSRFSASGVFGVLQQDIVARRFGLAADALQQVHDWLRACGTRWALDAPHRGSFGVPATDDHTWAQGLDRLFLGYALPSEAAQPFADLLPAGAAEGSAALPLGALRHFVECLTALRDAVAIARSPQPWSELLLDVLDTFTAPAGEELDDRRELQATIRELADTMQRGGLGDIGAPAVPLAVLRSALTQLLDDPARGGVPTGAVTFSSMSSLRSLPYRLVCVVGLNDGAFPTTRRPPEFDLMTLQPRRGDRQRRSDERNLFLDLMLAARDGLYLSFTGRSVRDNAPLPPSVLIAELLEVLTPAIADDPGAPDSLARARRRLVVEHPLQPFSAANFEVAGEPRLRSFNRELGEALQRSRGAPPVAAPASTGPAAIVEEADEADDAIVAEALPAFFVRPLAAPEPAWHEVSADQLIEFFRNPCRYLLRRRLGIDLGWAEEPLRDDEPFLPDWPARTALAARLLPPLLAGAAPDAVRRLALAGHELPAGALGRQQLELELETLQRFAERVRSHTAAGCLAPHQARVEFDLDGQAWRLQAGFADLRPDGLLRWRFDELRPGDALAAWVPHLLLCAAPAAGAAPRTRWLALDRTLQLDVPDDPMALLESLLRLYRRGLSEPLPFFPKSAWAYLRQGRSLAAAAGTWHPTRDRPHAEGADAAYRLALRGRGDALAGEFAALAETVFGPLLAAAQEGA